MDTRRTFLKVLAATPVAWAVAPRAGAVEYASAAEVFAAIDRLEADVAARLRGLARALPASRRFAESLLADQARHRGARAVLRKRLALATAAEARDDAASDLSLAGLRSAQEALVYAHAEGLPALDDVEAVDVLAHHMNDLSRHLTIIDLWIEAEQQRG